MNGNKENVLNKSVINWYPGHMAKTKRLIKENLNLIDIIYEIIDSRVPYSARVPDIDDITKDKPRILIFTKYDLCDKKETDKFIEYYNQKGYYTLKYDLTKNCNFEELFNLSRKILSKKIEKNKAKGIKKDSIRALVVGIPNVGKSTFINQVVGKKVVTTGNKPGVTKNLNWIRVRKDIELLDSPGILWPRLEPETVAYNLASTTAIKEEILPKDEIAIYILKFLEKYYNPILKENYSITTLEDIEEAFDIIGKKKGCLMKGGIVDDEKLLTVIINDIKQGKIKGITFDRSENLEQN